MYDVMVQNNGGDSIIPNIPLFCTKTEHGVILGTIYAKICIFSLGAK